jgi:hypothetical protein
MKRFIVDAVSIAIGVIGLILSIYFYRESIKERRPVFLVESVRTSIVSSDSTLSAPLVIRDLFGNEIKEDVTTLTFYFYNKGKESIRKEHVLEKLTLNLNCNCKVLSYKALKISRKITGINLAKDSINDAAIRLSFDILEENDGVSAQITYVGSRDAKLTINGIIEGVTQFETVTPTQDNGNKIDLVKFLLVLTISGLLTLGIISYLSRSFNTWMEKEYELIIMDHEKKRRAHFMMTYKRLLLFFIVYTIFGVAMFVFVLFKSFDLTKKQDMNDLRINIPIGIRI